MVVVVVERDVLTMKEVEWNENEEENLTEKGEQVMDLPSCCCCSSWLLV